MDLTNHDAQLRQAAFNHVNRVAALRGGILFSADLAGGFVFDGDRIPLINPQRGIFKPSAIRHWHDDAIRAQHTQPQRYLSV